MKKSKLTALLTLLYATAIQSQKVETALRAWNVAYPQEKIYIHYNKDYYAAGETIGFKSYLYNNVRPGGVSNNFYVQLINDKGTIVTHREFPVVGAVVNGSIDIPNSLEPGNYYVRALTPNIINCDDGLVYKKRIPIYSWNAEDNKRTNPEPGLSLQFYPESGDLLDDMVMTVGFKAVNEKGLPVAVNGFIKLEEGTNIAPFRSYHDGIGKMQLKVKAGKKYIAEVETSEGIKKFPLPEVKQYGVNLKVSDEKGGKKFLITRRVMQASDYSNLTLVADINNEVVYKMEIAMEDYPDAEGHLATDSLPSGILHFTLFDKNKLPLCERLAFVNNNEYHSKGELKTVKVSLQKRAANELEIQFPDNTLRSCSVSVTDIASTEMDDVDNIYSRLLLTGNVKGYIYNAAWYFREGNDSSSQALDNLLLTHGWSRFNWQKVIAGQIAPKNFDDPYAFTILGDVFDQKTNKPVSNGTLNLLLELGGGKPYSYIVPVDASGKFRIDSLAYYGETKIYFDYADKSGKDKPITVQIKTIPDQTLALEKTKILPLVIDDAERYHDLVIKSYAKDESKDAKSRDSVKVLQTAVVKTAKPEAKRPTQMLDEKYTSGLFSQQARSIIDNETIPANDANMDALSFIRNRFTQVELRANGFYSRHKNTISGARGLSAPGAKASTNIVTGYPVLLYLNEVQIDIAQLKALSAKDIGYVKYFENFVGGGIGTIGGAISAYTINRDQSISSQTDYPEYFLKVPGYSITKEFFSPDYGDPTFKQPEIDNRATVYWDPNIITGSESNTIKLNFYNNDFSTKLKVTVEGLDATGRFVHIEKVINR